MKAIDRQLQNTATRRGLLYGAMGAGIAASTFGLSAHPAFAAARRVIAPNVLRREHPTGAYGMRYIEVDGLTWAFRDKGEGPAALFLPSFFLNANMWLDQMNGLSDIRRCITPDYAGWGMSEPVTDRRPDESEYADRVVRFIETLGIGGKIDLVGLSMGGMIGGLVCERIPNRINSLTLISYAGFDFQRDLAYERYQQEMARLFVVESKDTAFRRFNEYITGPNTSLMVRARYKQMLMDSRTEMFVSWLSTTGEGKPRPDLPSKINVPVMIPVGSADVVLTEERAKKLVEGFPNAEIVRIEGPGRLLPLESPETLNRILREFWTGRASQNSVR